VGQRERARESKRDTSNLLSVQHGKVIVGWQKIQCAIKTMSLLSPWFLVPSRVMNFSSRIIF